MRTQVAAARFRSKEVSYEHTVLIKPGAAYDPGKRPIGVIPAATFGAGMIAILVKPNPVFLTSKGAVGMEPTTAGSSRIGSIRIENLSLCANNGRKLFRPHKPYNSRVNFAGV